MASSQINSKSRAATQPQQHAPPPVPVPPAPTPLQRNPISSNGEEANANSSTSVSRSSSLRQRILSTTSFKNMLSSVSSSGTSTPKPIEKTDSVTNLTKPSLYGIYNDSSVLDLSQDQEEDNYASLAQQVRPPLSRPSSQGGAIPRKPEHSKWLSGISLVIKLVIVTGSAFLYNAVTDHVHSNHIKVNNHFVEPIVFTQWFLNDFLHRLSPLAHFLSADSQPHLLLINDVVALVIQGVLMASVFPVMDWILPDSLTTRLLSSNPNPRSYNATLTNDVVRAGITFLGISYAIRKIEWHSTLQISIVWSLLNPGLWLLLDGTVSGLLSSFVSAVGSCFVIYVQNAAIITKLSLSDGGWDKTVGIWLWVGSYFFCGLIIFGKLGRALAPTS